MMMAVAEILNDIYFSTFHVCKNNIKTVNNQII